MREIIFYLKLNNTMILIKLNVNRDRDRDKLNNLIMIKKLLKKVSKQYNLD